MKISLSKTSPVLWFALGALVVGGTGTAYAANGGTFRIGQSNTATATTKLTNTKGTALKIISKASSPPISVGSNSTKVAYLNSDRLDGKDSTAFVQGKMYVAQVNSTGTKANGTSGVTTNRLSLGQYEVLFPRVVAGCFAQVTLGNTSKLVVDQAGVSIGTSVRFNNTKGVYVYATDNTGSSVDVPFVISTYCP